MSLKPYDITKADSEFRDCYDQIGHGISVYSGTKYQRGYGLGNILSTVLQKALPLVKRGALSLGKEALQTGLNIAKDSLEGKDIKTSFRDNFKAAGQNLLRKGINTIATGVSSSNINRKRKRTPTKRVSASKGKRPRRVKRDIFS
jgi:hypothetical protein